MQSIHRSYNTNLYCSNSYNMNLNWVTDSHVELNILDNTQECLNNSHHKIACLCELVEESTLATSEKNTSIAFGYYCCEIEADAPQFNYHYAKLKGTQTLVLCEVKDFFDSDFNVSMIKRSALPEVIITSCLVIPDLWGPLQVTLKHTKLSWCKTRDCPSLTKTGASINKTF